MTRENVFAFCSPSKATAIFGTSEMIKINSKNDFLGIYFDFLIN